MPARYQAGRLAGINQRRRANLPCVRKCNMPGPLFFSKTETETGKIRRSVLRSAGADWVGSSSATEEAMGVRCRYQQRGRGWQPYYQLIASLAFSASGNTGGIVGSGRTAGAAMALPTRCRIISASSRYAVHSSRGWVRRKKRRSDSGPHQQLASWARALYLALHCMPSSSSSSSNRLEI